MTIGIYALYWEEQDLIYIGQSQNIEGRYTEHLRMLRKSNHSNYRVQETYNQYGVPVIHIVEPCAIDSLNSLEVAWTSEFDSINTGLNLVEAGSAGWGTRSNNSKYTKTQVLGVFRQLYLNSMSRKNISLQFAVSIDLVNDIRGSRSHLWLMSKYPRSYAKMLNTPRDYSSYSKYETDNICFKHISGVTVEVNNIREFARNNGLINTCLSGVARGTRKTHKGWSLQPTIF